MKKAGEIYAPVNHHSPDTARGFLKDKCGLTDEELDSTKEGFIGDIGREGVRSAYPIWHNWAWRRD